MSLAKAERVAKRESKKSTMLHQLGAAILKRNKIIGKGYNIRKTNPHYGSGIFKMLHAEGAAIYDCMKRGEDMRGATLFIYRKNGRLAKPCKDCEDLIKSVGIRKVIYTTVFN